MNFIFKINWVKYYTKEIFKTLKIVLIGFFIITILAVIKYKPVYAVTMSGKKIGYIDNKQEIEQKIGDYINDKSGNVAFRVASELPKYEFMLVSRDEEDSKEKVFDAIEEVTKTTYKSYAIVLDGEKKVEVASEKEAMEIVDEIKKDFNDEIKMTLGIETVYSEKLNLDSKENAQNQLNEIKQERVKEYESKKAEEERLARIAAQKKAYASTTTLAATGEISGMAISIPVSGSISSRFGERSSSRSSAHTGLDISAPMGTGIRPIASGTVTFAADNGSYGNLIKVDHGNGIESWYAHCSAIYVSVGQTVDSSTTIAAVGSTGNSTGPHLHLEIRIGGTAVNPQNYLYN